MQHRTPHQLVDACLDGDQSAWNELIDAHAQLVYTVARRQGLGDADVEDVFQAVFMNLFRGLSRVRDAESIPKWLITSTQRECWRIGRKQGRDTTVELNDHDQVTPEQAEADTQRTDLEQLEEEHILRTALAQLGHPCEGLLNALFAEPGHEHYENIAESLGMPIGSIGPTRNRCLSKLRKRLAALGLKPDENDE